jgi:hypothetical protein
MGQGLGGKLVDKVVEETKIAGGRLLIAETSGKAEYAPTRQFYAYHRFQQAAVITDFYAPGNDQYLFVRSL